MTYDDIISKVLAASPESVLDVAEALVAGINREGAALEASTILSIAARRAAVVLLIDA